MTNEPQNRDHVCQGMAISDGWRVYFDEGYWHAEIIPGDFIIVSHCPWCGQRLSLANEASRVYAGFRPVFHLVEAEIRNARAKHGKNSAGAPDLDLMTRFGILTTEFLELSREVVNYQFVPFTQKAEAAGRVRGELLQVAAVATHILEALQENDQ